MALIVMALCNRGYFFISPICETTGYSINTDYLTGITRTPSHEAEGLYDILCGTTLQHLVEALEKDGRAIVNLGGHTGLSLSVRQTPH
jgi:acetylglutamate kinase